MFKNVQSHYFRNKSIRIYLPSDLLELILYKIILMMKLPTLYSINFAISNRKMLILFILFLTEADSKIRAVYGSLRALNGLVYMRLPVFELCHSYFQLLRHHLFHLTGSLLHSNKKEFKIKIRQIHFLNVNFSNCNSSA